MKYTPEEMKAAMARKITRKDIEELKASGIDHWAFDEMEFEEDKKTMAKEKIDRAGLNHLIANEEYKGQGFQIIGGFPKPD